MMLRKCRNGEKPQSMFRRDKPISTVKHELFIQQRAKRFEEDYTVIRKLGEGSFGLVYEVMQKPLGIKRALKIVRNTSNDIYSTREEIDVLTQMDHPNVLKLYEYYEVKDCFYLITELFDGKELIGELITENSFTEAKASEIALEILKALFYTHTRNIAHRDLKAENLLVQRKNGKWVIKVIDWGLGAIVGKEQLHRKCGTPEYAAPEIFQGNYNQQCDMWSLGVMIFVMLSGEHPFKGANFGQTMHRVINEAPEFNQKEWQSVSEHAKDLVLKLLVKDPKTRLTASQAMDHPWFQLSRQCTQPVELSFALENLRDFRISNSLMFATMNYVNNCLSTEEERRQLSEIFKYLDRDNDGVLSFDELVEGYTGVYSRSIAENIVDDIFLKIDMNHSGRLEYNEFVTYAMLSRKIVQENKLKAAFQMFDMNADGRISLEETKEILFHGMEDIDEKVIQSIMEDVDENGDGYIDEYEFMKFLSTLSHEVDDAIDTPLSFLGDCKSMTTQSESQEVRTPTPRGSCFEYKFDEVSTTNVQTEASDNSTSSLAKCDTSASRIEVEEDSLTSLTKKSESTANTKHTRYRETKIRALPEGKRPQTRNHVRGSIRM